MVAILSPPKPRFALGEIVATPGALAALTQAVQTPLEFLARHVVGDWGDVNAEDGRANDAACAREGDADQQDRLLSAYITATGTKIWIITERDRSVTTLLLPDEY